MVTLKTKVRLEAFGSCTLEEEGCSLCGDSAVPVEVLHVGEGFARVQDRLGQQTEVATDFMTDIRTGDVLLVHKGVALARGEVNEVR